MNNLGLLVWSGNMRSRHHRIKSNQEYDETQAEFAERYPESLWNQREWVKVRGD